MDAVEAAYGMLAPCRACPRRCGIDRSAGQLGFCQGGALAKVASAGAHFGEESVLVGRGGSGTIFFQGCSLGCVFCQNYDISAESGGVEVTAEQLAKLMLDLQIRGCSNINFVTPTPFAPQMMEAVFCARRQGLRLPIIYNCGGYESVEMLKQLEGCVDVYMPDFKWGSPEAGLKYSQAEHYPEIAAAVVAEMFRQVGPLQTAAGLADRGVMVRHLVMPMDLADSEQVVRMVAEVAPGCGINVMGQYRPCHHADQFPELLLLPKPADIDRLRKYAGSLGLQRLDGAAAACV